MTTAERTLLNAQLERHEGRRPWLYDDATGRRLMRGDTVKGNVTGGIGWNFSARPLSNYLIDLMRDECVDECEADLVENFPWFAALSGARRVGVIDFRYNVGHDGFRTFPRFLAAMARAAYDDAANELATAPWFKEVGIRGPRIVAQIRMGKDG